MLHPSMLDMLVERVLDLPSCLVGELRFQILPIDTLALPHTKDKPLAALLIDAQVVLLCDG